MKRYVEIARILNAKDVIDYIERNESDLDFERNVRDRLREAIYRRFDERVLKVIESLSVIQLPIEIEVAKRFYDLDLIGELLDLGLVKRIGGSLFIDETFRDLIMRDDVDYHRKAIEYYECLEEDLDVCTEKSYHHLMAGDYEKSFELFIETANRIYGRHRCVERLIFVGEKLIGKVEEVDRLFGTLGNLYMVLRRYEEAEGYYKRVLRMYEESGDERLPGVMLNLAKLYYVKGNYGKAEDFLKDCLRISNDDEITENALLILSSLYLDLNKFEKAEGCLMDVLRIEHSKAKLEPERMGRVASILNNLGFVYSKGGNFEKAERFYKEALRIYNEINDVEGVITALNNLCSIYIANERFGEAKEILNTLKGLSEFPPDLKAKYHFLRAKILEREGNLDMAIEDYVKSGALGFLVFRNFGINAVNYMHAFDKAEEIAKRIGREELAGDIFIIKCAIGKIYFGIRRGIGEVRCGSRGKIILKALRGEDVKFDVVDELDSVVFVITRDLNVR